MYYFILAYWFNEIIRSICQLCLDKSEKTDNKDSNDCSEIFALEEELLKLILLNISDLLAGFLVLYTNIKMKPFIKKKKKRESKNIKNRELSLIYNSYGDNHKYKFVLIILISCLDFIFKSINLFSVLPKIK